jgi:hypothetical protein
VLFFIAVGSRRVSLGSITRQPDSGWMAQVARNATMHSGYLNGCRYLLHDRDQKFCREFQETLSETAVKIADSLYSSGLAGYSLIPR